MPPPRAHLTRFHGVFAPNANLRAQLTPSRRGKRPATDAAPVEASVTDEPRRPEEKRRGMTWAQRLKRVFTPGILPSPSALRPPPSALRASLRLFQIAPGDLVRIDVSTCVHCGGAVRIVASIEEPIAIRAHFEKHGVLEEAHYRPRPRGPPPWTWPRSRKIGHATNRDNQQRLDAAANPQGRAWPDAGIQ